MGISVKARAKADALGLLKANRSCHEIMRLPPKEAVVSASHESDDNRETNL